MANNNQMILPGAGPFYFEGNKVGILLIHGGGGGTSADLKPLAEDLHMKGGYTIILPLLPGYGTSPKDLKNTKILDWKSTLDKEISTLTGTCEKIIVGGHSMGGVLTLILAADHNFDAIFTISAPIGLKRFIINFIPLINLFLKYHRIDSEQFRKDTKGKWVGYDKIPLNIVLKMKKLMREMKKSLLNVNCPVLLFQGRLDSDIKKNSMNYIFNNIKSKRKEKIWLENNDHPILDSPDHQIITLELVKFINEICT